MNESFEKTYPRYPFAELVGLGIAVAKVFARKTKNQHDTRLPHGATPATH
jgi:hypothetical protein